MGDFSVSIKVKEEDSNWWFSGVYGPNSYTKRNLFWDELACLWSICGLRW